MAVCGACGSRTHGVVLCFLGVRFPSPRGLVAPVYPLRANASPRGVRRLFGCSGFGSGCGILGRRIHGFNVGIPPLIGTCVDLSPGVHMFNATVGRRFKRIRRANVLVTVGRVLRSGGGHRVRACLGRRNGSTSLVHGDWGKVWERAGDRMHRVVRRPRA